MLKWLKQLKNKDTGNSIIIGGGKKNSISNKNYKILKIFSLSKALDKYKSNYISNNNIDDSINEYISKLRKKLILIEKLTQDNNDNPKRKISSSNSKPSIRSKEDLYKKYGINKTKKDENRKIWNEPEQYGQKMTMALNLSQVPFIKFKINPREAFEEVDYIFSKKIRSINEMIYLQHLLTLYDVIPSIFVNCDLIEPNEVLFNMAICLNMHNYKSNELIFKYGEYTDKLFFVLSGSVSLFEPVERSCKMDIDQYISYLNQLENCEEYELIKKIIDINKVYKNDSNVLMIKNNNEKYIRKKYLQKIKAIKEIIKNQDYSTIEVNLNTEINSTIDTTEDTINLKEIISSEEYIRRIIPSISTDIKKEEKKENEKSNPDDINKLVKNKRDIKYYSYSLVKEVKPFNTFGEIILDDEENKNNINNNNSNNFRKRELTAICNEPSRILYLDINNWQKYFKNRQDSIKMKNILTILDIPFLRHINIDYFKEKIFDHFSLFNYKIGEYIFKQNDKRKKIYFVVSGEVELTMNASINDINNIIDKKFDKNDIYYRNKLSETQKIKYIDSYYLINKLNKEKSTKTWRILGIYPKDIIGLNEILDENNCAYYVSAKCSSFNCEVYEIEYNKFKEMISENKNINNNVRNLFVQYTKNKMNFISKRLKALRTIYINKKLKTYKNYLKTSFSCTDKIKIKNTKSNFNKKLNLKLALFNNNILEPSLSSKNIITDNYPSLNQFNLKTIYNYGAKGEKKSISLHQNILRNSSFKNTKLFNYKYKNSSNNTNYFNIEEFNDEIKKNKKRNQIKFEPIFGSVKKNKLNDKANAISNSLKIIDKKNFLKTQTFFKTKSQRLIKFKDFNNLIKHHKNSKNKKYNLTQNSFFKHYLKEVKTIGVASAKKPEITPFSDILFSLADNDNKKNKNELKSATSSFIEYSASSNFSNNVRINSECQINTIDNLVLDKIVDGEGYSKFIEKDLNDKSISKSESLKILRNQIKIINQKKQFPQHLIRRFEANRKINYFPEKLLHFVK